MKLKKVVRERHSLKINLAKRCKIQGKKNMKILMDDRNHGAGTNSSSHCTTVNGISCPLKNIIFVWIHNT